MRLVVHCHSSGETPTSVSSGMWSGVSGSSRTSRPRSTTGSRDMSSGMSKPSLAPADAPQLIRQKLTAQHSDRLAAEQNAIVSDFDAHDTAALRCLEPRERRL